jgi:hypothetical protein
VKNIVTDAVYEDSGFSLMARIYGQAATAITQATISSIALKVFDISSSTQIATATPVVATCVFDTLQTDAYWTKDSTGYNFRYSTLAAHVPAGCGRALFEFTFTPSSGAVFPVVFEVPVLDLYGS